MSMVTACDRVKQCFEHALEALRTAAVVDDVPAPLRAQVVEALVTTARVAALFEALAEGVVAFPNVTEEHEKNGSRTEVLPMNPRDRVTLPRRARRRSRRGSG
jgi:hypothetical protein